MRRSKILAMALVSVLTISSLAGCGGNSNNNTNPTTNSTNQTTTATGGNSETTASDNSGTTNVPTVDNGGKPIKDLVLTQSQGSHECETLNWLYTQTGSTSEVLTNLVDGLLSCDVYGNLVPAIATEWGTEDGGLTWTFKLRNDVTWVDVNGNKMADCTAQDFITGLEWVLNAAKNDANNTSMPIELIAGAKDYYSYTKDLSAEEAMALDNTKFLEMVGIEAPDDYTLIYHCTTAKPYFDSVATYNCLYPVSAAMIEQITPQGFKEVSNDQLWYNGCYRLTSFIFNNEKVMERNESYWDKDCTLFDSVTIKMVEGSDVSYQLYQAGEIDSVGLNESQFATIYNDPNHEYHDNLVETYPSKYAYVVHFNYNKRNDDGTDDANWNTAIANESFRQAWYYGLDFTEYMARYNPLNPNKQTLDTFTGRGLSYTSDGTDYTTLVTDLLDHGASDRSDGQGKAARLNAEKFAEAKAKAMEELSAQGVTFPVQADYFILSGSQTALDAAEVLKKVFSNCFGDDFVQLNIRTYVSNMTQEVRNPRLQSFMINGWGADYADPQNYLGQMTYPDDNAFYSQYYENIPDAPANVQETFEEYTKLVREADAITEDLDARYAAFAQAEVYMLNHAMFIPAFNQINFKITRINHFSMMNAPFGIQVNKYKNWETSTVAYTADDYAAFEAAFEAGRPAK
ncbi:MAG: ABC transporter substrate-binding protein [Lachnospiraceae bacterium]|nr:ABC transporter substrate-binding protein [Lachnospiraceae bacterium]